MSATLMLLVGLLVTVSGYIMERKKANGEKCFHHTECFSDCCLMNLDRSENICTSKGRTSMACLPQTKGAINIICPCRLGLTCTSKDLMCPRRCQMF